ncbi:trypsin domain-containing protein [Ditylenchus destructor]|uniref:Trypsin domain-containing protein n=1 Tax=Ditylenchus destructor TaxID=166010 RepID=A0AAD4MZP2_9BILA|nr:trypsin domain-containing protein [Ditylenchus destructor]
MFRFFVCFLPLLSLCAFSNAEPECGISEYPIPPTSHRIINGTLVKKGELPWVTAISIVFQSKRAFGCTGSIISRNHVLLAAHCCDDPYATYFIKFGTNDKNDEHAVNRLTTKVHLHNDYIEYKQHDIAILEFDGPLNYDENIRPICLKKTFNESESEKRALSSGFGAKKFFKCPPHGPCYTPPGASDGKLHRGSESFIPQQECDQKFQSQVNTTEFICAKGFNGTDTFKGDRGGPLSVKNPERSDGKVQWMQVGISSFGDSNYPIKLSAFTRVSLYCDWIAKTTKNAATCRD